MWFEDPNKHGVIFITCSDDHLLFQKTTHCFQCSKHIVEVDGKYVYNYIYQTNDKYKMKYYQLCSRECEIGLR